MPWIERENGIVVGVNNIQQEGNTEELPDDNPEVVAYRSPKVNKLDQLEELISQGQIAMTEAPLPEAIQKQIFDLEVFIQNYYRRGAISLIVDSINSFAIPNGYPGVTDGQRGQVAYLKGQMLEVFSGN